MPRWRKSAEKKDLFHGLRKIHRGVSRRGNRWVKGGKMALSRARSANANSKAVTRVYFKYSG